MRAALLAHDEVLRTAIEAHDGFLFSHTGDGVVAAFASPRSRCRRRGRCAAGAGVAGADGHWRPVRPSCGTGTTSGRCSTGRRG